MKKLKAIFPMIFVLLGMLTSTVQAVQDDFEIRFSGDIIGNIRIIGNTVLQSSNATIEQPSFRTYLEYTDVDSDADTFNSSSATLASDQAGVDISNASIVWAGLYWQGYMHNNNADPSLDTEYNISSDQALANSQINNILETPTVRFKVGTGAYHTVAVDDLNKDIKENRASRVSYTYAGFADVTALVQGNAPNTTYTVGNIPTKAGKAPGDNLGNYGGWALVIIYTNEAAVNEKPRNIVVYDGYALLHQTNNRSETINLSGFLAPLAAPNGVDAKVSIFGGGGDHFAIGDKVVMTGQDGTVYDLPYDQSTGFFDSNIEGVPHRNPELVNNYSITIKTAQVGTSGGASLPVKERDSSATLELNTTFDYYSASLVTFSTEIFVPNICYEYVIQKDDFTLSSEDREIKSFGNGDVSLGVAIKSLEGDLDFIQSSLKVELNTSSSGMAFDEAFYSPNTVNVLIPAIPVPHASGHPNIAVGKDASSTGGTISRFERYFTKFDYTQSVSTYEGTFDFDLNMTIDLNSTLVPLTLSTKNGSFKRCPINNRYAPEWSKFNVERTNSGISTDPNIRYPLYTQITGRDFDISVVSYRLDNAGEYHELNPINDTTVDVELIDVKPFGDQEFKCTNTLESIVKPLRNGRKSFFVAFPDSQYYSASSRTDVLSARDLEMQIALQNAAFRVWYFEDSNNSIIKHRCTQPFGTTQNDDCFKNSIGSKLDDPTDLCSDSNCSTYASPRGETGCYACYRDYFAKPVCSRDNFSIRPESYRLNIADDNESNNQSAVSILNNNARRPLTLDIGLAAGYNYKFDSNATIFGSIGDNALQYNTDVNATIQFNDSSTCADTNDTNLTYVFRDGKIVNSNDFSSSASIAHNNVGDYNLSMLDKVWTKVDQRGFTDQNGVDLKTFPLVDDCIRNDANTSSNADGKSGCDISSNTIRYNNIALTFEPYQFDMTEVNLTLNPDNNASFLLMNDLSHSDYDSNNINMSARFSGIIQAKDKNNRTLSNYTKECHAEDKNITLLVGRTTSPIDEQDLTSITGSQHTQNDVHFQQKLKMSNTSQTVEGFARNVILSGLEFNQTQAGVAPGEARIQLDTTFKKPSEKSAAVNPFDVNYTELNATSASSTSFAHQGTYIPDGNNSYGRSFTYYFAKVTPLEEFYGPVESSSITTPIFVDVFCAPTDGNISICTDRFNLNTISKGLDQEAGWFAATMFAEEELGTMDLNASTSVTVQDSSGSSTDISFAHLEASRNDINVSIESSATLPFTAEITVNPVPYLLYDKTDPDGFMHYKVRFIGNSAWSGFGNEGKAIGTTSNKDTSPRMNW